MVGEPCEGLNEVGANATSGCTRASPMCACGFTLKSGFEKRAASGIVLRLNGASGSVAGSQSRIVDGNQYEAYGCPGSWVPASAEEAKAPSTDATSRSAEW